MNVYRAWTRLSRIPSETKTITTDTIPCDHGHPTWVDAAHCGQQSIGRILAGSDTTQFCEITQGIDFSSPETEGQWFDLAGSLRYGMEL